MKEYLGKMLKNRFASGLVIFFTSNLFISVLNYLFVTISARVLGPARYSEIGSLFSFLLIVAVPFQVVAQLIIQKSGARTDKQRFFENILSYQQNNSRKLLVFYLVISFLITFIGFMFKLSLFSSISLGIITFLGFNTLIYLSALQSMQRFWQFSLTLIGLTVVKIIGPIFIVFITASIYPLLIFLVLGYFVQYLLSRFYFEKLGFGKSRGDQILTIDKLFDKQFWLTAISIGGVTCYANLDVIFAKLLLSDIDAGLYTAWNLFAKMILYLMAPLSGIAYIYFTEVSTKKQHTQKFITLSAFTIFLMIIMAILYSLFADTFINIIFGQNYLSIDKFLGLAGIFGGLYALLTIVNNYYLAKGNSVVFITGIGVPIYILLMYLFVHKISDLVYINIFFSLFLLIIMLGFKYKSNHAQKQ